MCHDLVPALVRATSLHVPGLVSLAGVHENSESMSVSEISPLVDKARWKCSDRSIPPPSYFLGPPSADSVSSQSPYAVSEVSRGMQDGTYSTRCGIASRAGRAEVVWQATTGAVCSNESFCRIFVSNLVDWLSCDLNIHTDEARLSCCQHVSFHRIEIHTASSGFLR